MKTRCGRVGEQSLLLNGLFGVSNQESVDFVEVLRIIMNFTPSNAIFRGLMAILVFYLPGLI